MEKKTVLSSGGNRRTAHQLDPKPVKDKEAWLIDTCIYKADPNWSHKHSKRRCKHPKVGSLKCRFGCNCPFYLSNKEYRLSKKGNPVNLKEELGIKKLT